MQVNIALLTVTDTRPLENDKSGSILVKKIEGQNHKLVDRKIVKDNKDEIKKVISGWLKKKDLYVIITTGGASVGDEDHLIDTLKNNGEIFFWRAAIKPGRPIAIWKIKKTYIVCLPGNPVSVQLLFAFVGK